MSKYEALKKNLQEYFEKYQILGRKHIFQVFTDLGAPERSLNRWLTRLESNTSLARKVGSGRPTIKATKGNITLIKKKFNHRSGCSQRRVARELNISQPYVSIILKKYTSIKCRKKSKRPAMSEKQKQAARPKCRKIRETYQNYEFILDDECYMTKSNSTLAGNDRFYSDDLESTPEDVKNKFEAKFEEKVLVYVAISPRGISKALFFKSGLAINQHVYLNECLKKSLIPFIRTHHRRGRYVFWPDLASAHYAKAVQDFLHSENVTFIPKSMNPANVPKVRPIEDFWGILKQKVYEGDWAARDVNQLKSRIKWALKNIDQETFLRLTEGVSRRLDIVARYGIEAL
jgi:predicted transcriptional regulator